MRQANLYLGRTLRSTVARDGSVEAVLSAAGLAPGIYRVSVRTGGPVPSPPRLAAFIDTGHGFKLASGAEPGASAVLVRVVDELDALLLTAMVTDRAGPVGFRIRKLTTLERIAPVATWLGRRLITDPRASLDLIAAARRRARTAGGSAAFRLIANRRAQETGRDSYDRWIAIYEGSGDPPGAPPPLHREPAPAPRISFVIAAGDAPWAQVEQTVRSILRQTSPQWEIRLAVAPRISPDVRDALEREFGDEPRVALRPQDSPVRARIQSALLAECEGEWLAVLAPGETLSPTAVADVLMTAEANPSATIIYTDEDRVGPDGIRRDPWFKPEYSREMLRCQNYFGHLTAYRTSMLRHIGGWREGFDGAESFDLNLRAVEQVDASGIVHIPRVLCHVRMDTKVVQTSVPGDSAVRALSEHLARSALHGEVRHERGSGGLRMTLALPDPAPHVTVIIPTRDALDDLRACVESVLDRTTYPSFDVLIVDNDSQDPATIDWLAEISRSDKVSVLEHPGPFNFAAINNHAVDEAAGPIVALLNNDIVVITPEWLTEMVSWAIQPDVGCVGAMLYYPDDTIQHAGVVLGVGGVAGHSHRFFPRGAVGYHGRLTVVGNVSAVTGACLVVRKDVYLGVGGMNADDLAVAFNDVDFSLRVREAGFVNVWTPFAELYHVESASRGADNSPARKGRFAREASYMRRRWDLSDDPYYSPNLTRDREDFSLRP